MPAGEGGRGGLGRGGACNASRARQGSAAQPSATTSTESRSPALNPDPDPGPRPGPSPGPQRTQHDQRRRVAGHVHGLPQGVEPPLARAHEGAAHEAGEAADHVHHSRACVGLGWCGGVGWGWLRSIWIGLGWFTARLLQSAVGERLSQGRAASALHLTKPATADVAQGKRLTRKVDHAGPEEGVDRVEGGQPALGGPHPVDDDGVDPAVWGGARMKGLRAGPGARVGFSRRRQARGARAVKGPQTGRGCAINKGRTRRGREQGRAARQAKHTEVERPALTRTPAGCMPGRR